jgi:hypothetical protein
MGKLSSRRKGIVDAIIAEATNRLFAGDERDGAVPPITLQNFFDESIRYGAKALRARLSRLSRADLLEELNAASNYIEARQERLKEYLALAEQNEREDAARTRRQRQAELGRRHSLQPAILAAARHYRTEGKNAKQAWKAIGRKPLSTPDGETVLIKGRGDEERMCVQSRGGKQQRSGIKINHWQKRYWPRADGS